MNIIMKIIQALEGFNVLLKGVTKTIKDETKMQKGGFLSMLLGTLGASFLGNLLSEKGIVRAGSWNKKEKELQKLALEKIGIFNATSSFKVFIIKMNQDLMEFFQEIIYQNK